ncbi:hypothetical protein Nepgr_005863 [Nepenthes gracilis]|uniref:Uncharacterized protein n=1 Tax=Nepenthes gracilis TaxID=150966 RepID=A0AAD3S3Z3_NEPGR|nr:hypothetical protein Nepgr_005863 [Nepenthes gracilis]
MVGILDASQRCKGAPNMLVMEQRTAVVVKAVLRCLDFHGEGTRMKKSSSHFQQPMDGAIVGQLPAACGRHQWPFVQPLTAGGLGGALLPAINIGFGY